MKFIYKGPVMYFGRIISHYWVGETTATSKAKAVSNLKYQFKAHAELVCGTGGISFLPEKVKEYEDQ